MAKNEKKSILYKKKGLILSENAPSVHSQPNFYMYTGILWQITNMAELPADMVLSVPKFYANLYCICLSIDFRYTYADAA